MRLYLYLYLYLYPFPMHEKKIFTKRCFHSFAACPLPLMVGLWECGSTMAVEAWETW